MTFVANVVRKSYSFRRSTDNQRGRTGSIDDRIIILRYILRMWSWRYAAGRVQVISVNRLIAISIRVSIRHACADEIILRTTWIIFPYGTIIQVLRSSEAKGSVPLSLSLLEYKIMDMPISRHNAEIYVSRHEPPCCYSLKSLYF